MQFAGLILAIAVFYGVCIAENGGICSSVHVESGPVTGVDLGAAGLCEYRGIPYAAPPVGPLRFEKPAPHPEWQTPYLAYEFGPPCLQYPKGLIPSKKLIGSEDCLYLNIWQPKHTGDELMPVMVFIHGGGFVSGSGSQDIYHGNMLAAQGRVVVVTLNYRLGAAGFFAHPALRGKDGTSGNYGIYDMAFALRWIRENIRGFNGNPGNITVFGQSSGAAVIANFVVSPAVSPFFDRAIMQSAPLMMISRTLQEAEAEGISAAAELGCGDSDDVEACLKKMPADKFYGITGRGAAPGTSSNSQSDHDKNFSFQPHIDGALLPGMTRELLDRDDNTSDIEVIIGVNRDETTIFNISNKIVSYDEFKEGIEPNINYIRRKYGAEADSSEMITLYAPGPRRPPKQAYIDMTTDTRFVCPARNAARLFASKGASVRFYLMAKSPADTGFASGLGAFHGCELPFVFGNFKFMGLDFSSRSNMELSRRIIDLWTSFARTGIPRAFRVPEWTPYDPAEENYLYIGDEITIEEGIDRPGCDYLEDIVTGSFR